MGYGRRTEHLIFYKEHSAGGWIVKLTTPPLVKRQVLFLEQKRGGQR